MKSARLFLLTGFLGSGKTTVLNGLLRALSGRRVGVIVNEWGTIGVDQRLLLDPSGLGVVELAGGQIFCSCVSGSFIAAAARLAAYGLDYLLVETSGLAKPSALATIVAEAERRAGGGLSYRGMLCAVDATRFLTLRQAAAVVDEQVVCSDRFVVTKPDLADRAALLEVRGVLERLRPGAPATEAVRGDVDASILEDLVRRDAPAPDPRFRGWGPAGRPGTTTVVPAGPVSEAGLRAFLAEVAPEAFRIKGFVPLAEGGTVLVDGVGDRFELREEAAYGALPEDARGLALVWKGSPPDAAAGAAEAARRVSGAWERLTGTAARVS